MNLGKNIRVVIVAALHFLTGATALGCASATLPAAAGDAADPNAAIREEQPPPNALGADFDPFAAYPELRGGSGGHQHHMHHASPAPEAAAHDAGEMPGPADAGTPAGEGGKR